ncbi:MAG: hypothetical protein DME13_20385 [Candidatus Rokuibacteriota bacterium]|nr:MAG: hypothetical protein DME13_20385 [Candidatus Rokubacteria bacterium]
MNAPALRTRVLILAALLAVAFVGLTSRLGWLMIVKRAELAALAERQYSRTVTLHGARGPILDRHGAPLATSTPAESLFAQPRAMGDPVRVAARLAPVLDAPERELHAQLTSGKGFVWLRRKLPPAVAARVRGLGEPGLGFLNEPLRLYPNRELAAHVLGFEGVDGGLEGIERALNDALTGTPGRAIVGRAARRRGARWRLPWTRAPATCSPWRCGRRSIRTRSSTCPLARSGATARSPIPSSPARPSR